MKGLYETLIDAALEIVRGCRELNLACRDPPVATTRLLERLGVRGYAQRSFWDKARKLDGTSLQIYKYLDVSFELRASMVRRKLLHVDNWLPVDYVDCQIMRDRCYSSPQGQALMLYVHGEAMGSEIRINVVRLLRILDVVREGLPERLLGGLARALADGDYRELASTIIDIAGLESVRIMLPRVPSSERDLLALSPAFRKALAKGP